MTFRPNNVVLLFPFSQCCTHKGLQLLSPVMSDAQPSEEEQNALKHFQELCYRISCSYKDYNPSTPPVSLYGQSTGIFLVNITEKRTFSFHSEPSVTTKDAYIPFFPTAFCPMRLTLYTHSDSNVGQDTGLHFVPFPQQDPSCPPPPLTSAAGSFCGPPCTVVPRINLSFEATSSLRSKAIPAIATAQQQKPMQHSTQHTDPNAPRADRDAAAAAACGSSTASIADSFRQLTQLPVFTELQHLETSERAALEHDAFFSNWRQIVDSLWCYPKSDETEVTRVIMDGGLEEKMRNGEVIGMQVPVGGRMLQFPIHTDRSGVSIRLLKKRYQTSFDGAPSLCRVIVKKAKGGHTELPDDFVVTQQMVKDNVFTKWYFVQRPPSRTYEWQRNCLALTLGASCWRGPLKPRKWKGMDERLDGGEFPEVGRWPQIAHFFETFNNVLACIEKEESSKENDDNGEEKEIGSTTQQEEKEETEAEQLWAAVSRLHSCATSKTLCVLRGSGTFLTVKVGHRVFRYFLTSRQLWDGARALGAQWSVAEPEVFSPTAREACEEELAQLEAELFEEQAKETQRESEAQPPKGSVTVSRELATCVPWFYFRRCCPAHPSSSPSMLLTPRSKYPRTERFYDRLEWHFRCVSPNPDLLWSWKNHDWFPASFRDAVCCIFSIHWRGENPLQRPTLPSEVCYHIAQFL